MLLSCLQGAPLTKACTPGDPTLRPALSAYPSSSKIAPSGLSADALLLAASLTCDRHSSPRAQERTIDFAATNAEQLIDWYLALASLIPSSTEPLLSEQELRARIEELGLGTGSSSPRAS